MSDEEDCIYNAVDEILIGTDALPLGEDQIVLYEPDIGSTYSQSSAAYSYTTIPAISTPPFDVEHISTTPDIGERIVAYKLLNTSGSSIETVSLSELQKIRSFSIKPKLSRLNINCSFKFEEKLFHELMNLFIAKHMEYGSSLVLKLHTEGSRRICIRMFPAPLISRQKDIRSATRYNEKNRAEHRWEVPVVVPEKRGVNQCHRLNKMG